MAAAQEPLSVIDWLSDTVAEQNSVPFANQEDPVANSAAIEQITVTPLDAPSPDGVGLLPSAITGLPRDLWGQSESTTLVRLIQEFPLEGLPAVQDLFHRILLAELAPPLDASSKGELLQARVDALLARGEVDEASALLDRAGSNAPEMFRRAFDVSLLTGDENRACARLRATPGISPSFPVRIFCLARSGDWNAAALTLRTGEALGHLKPAEVNLLSRFLDSELFEGEPPLARPDTPSPLTFRMLEAIGEPIPSATLPLAFAHADLRSTAGWKARITAAERLARLDAIPSNRLLGIYSERLPAASGDVWDRIDAIQAFDTAYRARDPGAVADYLPVAWTAMRSSGLATSFADLYGKGLSTLPLTGKTQSLAFRIGLMTPDYEEIALKAKPLTPMDRFLIRLAQGLPPANTVNTPLAKAIVDGFAGPSQSLPEGLQNKLNGNRLGEALLDSLAMVPTSSNGDLNDLTSALVFLRKTGLEDVARQTSLQLMLADLSS